MKKQLSKSNMNRSRFKNRYLKWPSCENHLAYKIGKKLCNSLNTKTIKIYFENATEIGIITSIKFWSTVKLFLSLKDFIDNDNISTEIDNKIIENESELAKAFHSHYINIEKSKIGKHPTKLGTLAEKFTVQIRFW